MFIVYILKFFLLLFDLCFQLVLYFERVNLEKGGGVMVLILLVV